jgi:hypothetical protein
MAQFSQKTRSIFSIDLAVLKEVWHNEGREIEL